MPQASCVPEHLNNSTKGSFWNQASLSRITNPQNSQDSEEREVHQDHYIQTSCHIRIWALTLKKDCLLTDCFILTFFLSFCFALLNNTKEEPITVAWKGRVDGKTSWQIKSGWGTEMMCTDTACARRQLMLQTQHRKWQNVIARLSFLCYTRHTHHPLLEHRCLDTNNPHFDLVCKLQLYPS